MMIFDARLGARVDTPVAFSCRGGNDREEMSHVLPYSHIPISAPGAPPGESKPMTETAARFIAVCPNCMLRLKVKPSWSGSMVRCKYCGEKFEVLSPDAPPPSVPNGLAKDGID